MTNQLFNNGDKIKVAKFNSYNPVTDEHSAIVYDKNEFMDHVLLDSIGTIKASKQMPIYYEDGWHEWVYPVLVKGIGDVRPKKYYIEERLIESV